MPLPKRPKLGEPIPNADIPNVPEQYIVKAPYWDAVVSGNLVVNADGALTNPEGVGNGNPNSQIQGPYWNMPIGEGMAISPNGQQLIAAIPQLPPYFCNTNVYTTTVTDFTDAWKECTFSSFPSTIDTSSGTNFSYCWYGCNNLTSFPALDFASGEDFTYSWAYAGLTSFPQIDTSNGSIFDGSWYGCEGLLNFPSLDISQGANFNSTWSGCSGLTSFPLLDTSSGDNFYEAWAGCSNLTSFPLLNVSNGLDFQNTWQGCSSLTSFPLLNIGQGTIFSGTWKNCSSLTSFPSLDVSSGTSFGFAWQNCSSLTSFPAVMFDSCLATSFGNAWLNCALNQQSVDNILLSIDAAGQENGTLGINGGTSAAPGATGWAAVASLEAKGWTVSFNGVQPSITIGTQPSSSSVTAPASASFTVSATTSGGGTLGYQWQLSTNSGVSFSNVSNAGVYSGATTATLAISNSTGLNSLIYRVVVTSTGGAPSVNSSSATLTVAPACDQPPYGCNTSVNPYCVTDFTEAWQNCTSLTSFPLLDVSNGVDFQSAWYGCTSLTSFPLLDVGNGTNFGGAWAYCTSLTSFPLIDTSSGLYFNGAWVNCASLTTFPAGMFDNCPSNSFPSTWQNCALNQTSVDNILVSLDTAGQSNGTVNIDGGTSSAPGPAGAAAKLSLEAKGWTVSVNAPSYIYCTLAYPGLPVTSPPYSCNTTVNTTGVTSFANAWAGCSFTDFPCVDSSSVTNFSGSWKYCYSLASFPTLNTSSGTNFSTSWKYCTDLTTFPLINTSQGANFSGAWSSCYSLAAFPQLDVSQGTNFSFAWAGCTSLTPFPQLDVSQGTNFSFAWENCDGLTTFPLLDVSQGTNFSGAWQLCNNLASFPDLDLSSGTDFSQTWFSCTSLTTFPPNMFDNCLATTFTLAWSGCALNQTSVNNILVSLNTAGQNNGIVNISGGTSAAPSGAGLTAKSSLQAKGWTVITN